jgi:hypothetical protein
MSDMHSISEVRPRSAESLTFAQQEVLERAVAKLVLIGELVGVSADQMVLLLNSGLTMSELLEYLGVRTRQVIVTRAPLEAGGGAPEGG